MMTRRSFVLLLLATVLLAASGHTFAEEEFEELDVDILEKAGLTIDLRCPTYSEGIISTDLGGVITGPNMRIQAQSFRYKRKTKESPEHTVEAIGDVMLEFGEYIFVGDRLIYDLNTMSGVIENGRTMVEPWYFGGTRIYICNDGSYFIENAFVTTSENVDTDWGIYAQEATLYDNNDFFAKNMQLRIGSLPVFALPCFSANLDSIFDSPVRYSVRWGSRQGHRFGLIYEVFDWNGWKTLLRLDYRLKRGPGGGIETHYCSLDKKTTLETINYVARDSSIIHPNQRLRYRFQGLGDTVVYEDDIDVHLSYDKLSDIDMATDYNDRGLELGTAGRTELTARRQKDQWVANFITRLKINDFQTIKQELPTFETAWKPFELADTGVIYNTAFKASFLDFSYGNNQLYVHDYNATRVECTPTFYRPFSIGAVQALPEVGAVGIAYSNSPHSGGDQWLLLGKLGCSLQTNLTKFYGTQKHVITPYADYNYLTMPTVSPNHHYIFDIEDGWYRLNMLTFGLRQSLYEKDEDAFITRKIFADLYANTFFDTHTFPQAIPKLYFDVVFNVFDSIRNSLFTGWDFIHNEVDHFNVRTEWTYSQNFAMALEYRHRSPYDWRKADHTNFILDSYRSIQELRDSQLSDRRDTLLLHMFYRFHPSWALEFTSRSGWNRILEPSYNEFRIDLLGTLRSAWNFKLSYQHREDDDRISVYMTIGIKRPDCVTPWRLAPSLGF